MAATGRSKRALKMADTGRSTCDCTSVASPGSMGVLITP